MFNRRNANHFCLLFGCIASLAYAGRPTFELPDEIVNDIATFIIGIIFAVNVKNSEDKYSPLGQTYDALANIFISITLILKNLISVVLIIYFKGVRASSGDLQHEVLPRRIEVGERATSVALWIITSIYYPIINSSNPETRAGATITLFSLVVICLFVEFFHNSCISYRLSRFGGGPNCSDFCDGSQGWTICFSIFWTYMTQLRDRIAFLIYWIILLNHKGDELSTTRTEIDRNEGLLVLAKIAAIWYTIVQPLHSLGLGFATHRDWDDHRAPYYLRIFFQVTEVCSSTIARLPAGVALCVYLFQNNRTALYVSIGFAVAPAAFKGVAIALSTSSGFAKKSPCMLYLGSGNEQR